MGELTIRRNRGFSVPRYQPAGKAEKPAAAAQTQRVAKAVSRAVTETLQQISGRGEQGVERTWESRQTLQMGEVVLAEVEERLSRAARLAQESAEGDSPDRDALQTELDQLRGEIDRIVSSAVAGDTPLFLDGDLTGADSLDAFLNAALGLPAGKADAAVPYWIGKALGLGNLSQEQLLAALGLDRNASSAELLAAVTGRPLENSGVTAYVAAAYLGALVSAAGTGALDPEDAMAGLEQFLDQVASGMTPDEAIKMLTNGQFESMADFQAQFTDGTAPGLEEFLTKLLLADGSMPAMADPAVLTLLARLDAIDMELVMDLMDMLGSGSNLLEALETSQAPGAEGAALPTLTLGNVQVMGQDLSGVSCDAATGELTVGGTADVIIEGTGQGEQAVVLTGTGRVTVQDVQVSTLTVSADGARLFSAGMSTLNQVALDEGVTLTLGGSGQLRIGVLTGGGDNALHLLGGAVVMEEGENGRPGVLDLPVYMDGPASLAAQALSVSTAGGKPLEPFDLIWSALLPGWSSISALAVDGRQVQMALWNGEHPDAARLWLDNGDALNHGFSVHTVVVQGKDEFGRPKTRYAYVRWNQYTRSFETVSMYPNPFTVTGGRRAKDWTYEEATHTLYILSGQVTALAGGEGIDANQEPFSGRIVLADGIGSLELTLEGVVCQVAAGRAFDLGRENDVTLLLGLGSSNRFESGAGCAGISLGSGTSLQIDCALSETEDEGPDGELEASGGAGGAGIGRDSGDGGKTSHILIRGGVITAAGSGGGAGIGGAVGAPVGDICILGGTVRATADGHAAAIGAGVQGECGDVLISGSARITKAAGGDPGADIGACRFGRCGKVLVTDSADIGEAKLCTRAGILLQAGDKSATLPQFQLSARALGLEGMRLSTREYAREARAIVEADRRRVTQMQAAYSVLYNRLELGPVTERRAAAVMMGWSPLRDSVKADALLEDMRQAILRQTGQALSSHGKRDLEDVRQLLR